ncbi:hypothetical protein JB92DRAFT_3129569 [Gautieria morchelliformis]|nr:hypothetical protein JB92DRAFT_3129569 [Gautieria morchelliformis]
MKCSRHRHAGAGADVATSTINTFNTISATWAPPVDNIRLFTDIVDKASEVHPYAKMAWSILSLAHKPPNYNQDISKLEPAAGSIFNTLDGFNISWTNYVAQFPNGATPELFLINDDLTEAENPRNVVFGDAFISDVTHAIGNSPLWNKTLFIINTTSTAAILTTSRLRPPCVPTRPCPLTQMSPNSTAISAMASVCP